MGDWSTDGNTNRKEFWWEREWRRVGNFFIEPFSTVALLAPSSDHSELRSFLNTLHRWSSKDVPILDPGWGLERMIAVMSGVSDHLLGPFPG